MKDAAMITNINATIKDMLKVRLDLGCVVSVYLDVSADAKGQRHYGSYLKKEFQRLGNSLPQRAPLAEFLKQDLGLIEQYLAGKLEKRSKGAAIFISQTKGFLEALQTPFPFANSVVMSRLPYVYPLVRVADDHARYGIMICDEKKARLLTVNLGQIEEEHDIISDTDAAPAQGYETKKGRMGWADQRHKRHFKEQIGRHLKDAAAQARRQFGGNRAANVVLAAENGVLSELRRLLPKEIAGGLIATSRFDVKTPTDRILALSETVFRSRENEHSLAIADKVVMLARSKGGRAVTGTDPVLGSLMQGRAETVVIDDRYDDQGWQCGTCLRLGAGGKVSRCPYCGGGDVDAGPEMKEGLVELALRQGVKVEFVRDSKSLIANGGVGAILRN
jgi:peptide subunit release factor 1 (eRF1)